MDIHNIIFNRFTPSHSPSGVISWIIKQKFDEPLSSWKKVQLQVHDICFREFKGSRILKNAMNKIRNGPDHATWIPPNVRKTLDKHWAFTDLQNKRSIAKANRAFDKGASTYCGGSIST
ncbi:hypothetical protein CR513_06205, partial [Mucuna pruriens]